MSLMLMKAIPLAIWPVIICLAQFAILYVSFRRSNGTAPFYLDPSDFAHYEQGGNRELPVAAKDMTFEGLLKNYIDVMKLLITVAAASIAFGSTQNTKAGIVVAKIILAFSILYGVVFSGLLQFFYDEYTQNVRAYTAFRYSLIEALGFSALACFIEGYFAWAFGLG